MSSVFLTFVRGATWNTITFIAANGFRLATNVALARVLVPDLFGIMTIVTIIKMGIELISDFGAGQNIISSPNAENPRFYNTVFTFQIIRSVILWLGLSLAAKPIAAFYNIPELLWIIPISATTTLMAGFISPARDFLRKRMRFRELGVYETSVAALTCVSFIAIAFLSPNIWSLVIGGVLSSAFGVGGSYLLRAGLHLRFRVDREFSSEIFHYSKWIFLSSLAYFFSTYYDRLFYAKFVPLGMFGIYGIARSISDLVWGLAGRLGNNVLFPYVASSLGSPREVVRRNLASTRFHFIALSALSLAALATGSDLLIKILYDRRYHDATWLLPVLLLGSWFSILANVNEATLLGLGKPSWGAASNVVKLLFLIASLPIGVRFGGLLGATIVVAVADLPKLIVLQIGQKREQFAFVGQDALLTLAMAALVVSLEVLRWGFGLGTSLDTLPPLRPIP